ncbi:hypothetical protein N7519_010520 [Penicillium mononematosum]|uniref:uncharacterized protein n=1 Tax=Penicillium mononematosum TaxID=268346 RepID=UPI00254676B9|nr:uncharacterized protein N7519_010520 [Penicillium mononematosum]KAJ6180059.1 hypothetical protein N7519_010520 [Penicillium mononematosum]
MSPSPTTALCAGKTIVITGAAQGLGQAAAVAFAAAGAKRIAIVDSSCTSDTIERASQAAAEAGRTELELFPFHLNLGEAASIDTEFTKIHSRLGYVDILINTTEHISLFNLQRGTMEASNVDVWWKNCEASVKDAFVVARALLPLLLKGTEKTIVNVISARSPLLQFTSGTHDLSELAMMRLSEDLMLDYRNEGLLVYSLQPGHEGAKDMQQSVNLKLASEGLVYLTSERREQLGGRHLKCGEDMCDVISRDKWDTQNDLLEIGTSVKGIPPIPEKRRGRVPRSNY